MKRIISAVVTAAALMVATALWSPRADATACGALSGEARVRCVKLTTENLRAYRALKHRRKTCKPFVSARDYTHGRDPGCKAEKRRFTK